MDISTMANDVIVGDNRKLCRAHEPCDLDNG